jgi:signal transduction histidine kinase
MSRNDDSISRVEALGSDSDLIRNAASALVDGFENLVKITTDVELPLHMGREDYLLYAKPFKLNANTQWLIVSLSPKNSFLQVINRYNRFFLIMLLFLLLISVISAIYLARMISRPIEELNRMIQDPKNDWSEDPKPSMLVETDNLATELHEMQRTIQDNIETLFEEIQHRKDTEIALIQAKEIAEENNRLKSNFLSNMSHEVRTPLNGILGFAELLSEELKDEHTHNMATTVYKSGRRLMQTLDMVLDLSRIEANKQEVSWQVVDLNTAVQKPVHLFQPSAAKKHLELIFIPAEAPIFLKTDPSILDHIIHELVANARKFTEKGSIIVQIENKIQTEGTVCISVKDTGIGISAEHLNLVFEPFRQVSEGWSRSFEGTGLGLSLSAKYVKLILGEIIVQSELGLGSTFSLIFPANLVLDTPHEAHKPLPAQSPLLPITKLESTFLPKILLVDDDIICYSLVSKMLRNVAEVQHATDGVEAMSMLKRTNYPLILLDINLKSNLNGTVVLQNIRKLPIYNGVPVVAVTAYAMMGDRENLIESGFSDYLAKPFAKEDLLSILKMWLGI